MCDVRCMRTTLNLDEDVLRAVKELATLRGHWMGEVLSNLARAALSEDREEIPERNGVPILAPSPDARLVSPEDVAALLDEG